MRGKTAQPVDEPERRFCKHCKKTWSRRGFDNHFKACSTKAAALQQDILALRRIGEGIGGDGPARACSVSPEPYGVPTLEFDEADMEPDELILDEGNDCDLPSRTVHPPLEDQTAHEAFEERNDISTASDPSAREYDDIRVEFHPHSGRGTKIYRFEDYQRERLQPGPPDPEPWKPFASRDDFEFAEVVQQAGLTQAQIKTLLRIVSGVADGTSSFSLRSYDDLSHAWEKAMLNQPTFEKHTITVPHHVGERSYDVYVRNIEDLIIKQLQDPSLIQYFEWDARRMSKWKGSYWEDFVESEPVTGTKMWNVQSNIPKDAKPLGIFLYADKNKLSSFGTQQGYPVVMRITNIETHIRNGDGLGGGHVVAFLPVVSEEAGETGKTSFANLKREVWHRAMEKIIEPLIKHRLSELGLAVKCADAIRRLFYLFLHILSGDYEELCSMVLIRGNQCLFPCPMCLVPRGQLSDLSGEWRSRTQDQAQAIFCQYPLKGDRERATKALGLRPVQNAFWKLSNSDPHEAASVDTMHMDQSGLFGHHAFGEFKSILEKKRHLSVRIDANFRAMPRWRELNHFESGVLEVNFTDASKYNDISKVIVFASYNVLDQKTSPRGYSLLKLIRKYAECHLYLSMEVHTQTTLNDLYRSIRQLHQCIEEYRRFTDQDEKPKDWNFVKVHLRLHGISDIRAKGTLVSTTTKISEKFHGPMRKHYLRQTNFKDVVIQLARLNDIAFCSSTIREKIDILDAYMKAQSQDEDLTETTEFRFTQVYLGSRQPDVTLQDVEMQHRSENAFMDFRLKLNRFLFDLVTNLPRDETGFSPDMLITQNAVRLGPEATITECRFLKVHFECMCTGREEIDYLRCSPSFHGRPRYDGIIFQDVEDKQSFAKLLYVFVCKLRSGRAIPLALVLPMDKAVGPTRKIDTDLGLCRLKSSLYSEAIFVPLRFVIRGAFLYQNPSRVDEYVAVDLVDSDMYLRLRELFPARFS